MKPEARCQTSFPGPPFPTGSAPNGPGHQRRDAAMSIRTPSTVRSPFPVSPAPWRRWLWENGMVLLVVVLIPATLFVLYHLYRRTAGLYEAMAEQGSALQAQTLLAMRQAYTSEVVDRLQDRGVAVTADYRDTPGAIPLPATLTMHVGQQLGVERPGAEVRLYSDFPFPGRKDRTLDEFERTALREVRRDPSKPYSRFGEFNGRPTVRY